jgi:Flp pilus assembly protein TadD
MIVGPDARGTGPAFLLVGLLAAAVYLPALSGAFVSDDAVLVAANPAIRSWSAAFASFGRSYWYGLKGVEPYYRPLPILSYALDRTVAGLRPFPFHVTNVLLHAGCALLVALLVPALLRSREGPSRSADRLPEGAWLAGAIFAGALAAVHPLHSEPVAAIYGRPDLLAAFLTLATLNLALRGRTVPGITCLGLALLSKESAIGVPLLAPFALAVGARGRGPRAFSKRKAAVHLALSVAVLGGYLVLRDHAIGLRVDPESYTVLDNPLVHAEGRERWLTPVAVVGRYATLWIWPARLCADRGFDTVPPVASVTDPFFVLGAAILILGSIALAGLAASRSPWSLPLAAAGLTFLPASNLVVLSPAIMAERFAYLPSMLICVLLGGVYAKLTSPPQRISSPGGISGEPPRRRPAFAIHAAAAFLLVPLAARTYARAGDFKDDLALYGSAVASCPLSAKAQYNLGNALARAGRERESIAPFEAALAVAPWMAIAQNNMGTSYLHLGRFREAERAYRKASELSPNLLSPHESLAGLLYRDGRFEESLVEAQAALSLNPDPADAGQLRELVRRARQSLKTVP